MRPKLLLLALCLCAPGVMLGQNEPALVGMPELGVGNRQQGPGDL
jgi:hypothetical protein